MLPFSRELRALKLNRHFNRMVHYACEQQIGNVLNYFHSAILEKKKKAGCWYICGKIVQFSNVWYCIIYLKHHPVAFSSHLLDCSPSLSLSLSLSLSFFLFLSLCLSLSLTLFLPLSLKFKFKMLYWHEIHRHCTYCQSVYIEQE